MAKAKQWVGRAEQRIVEAIKAFCNSEMYQSDLAEAATNAMERGFENCCMQTSRLCLGVDFSGLEVTLGASDVEDEAAKEGEIIKGTNMGEAGV